MGGWGGGGGRGVRRPFAAALAVVLAGSLLAVVPVGLPLVGGPSEAGAQQVTSAAVLNRVTIVEGQTRTFAISNVVSRPRLYVHASVAGSFTAEAGDVSITTDNLHGQAQTITPDADAPRAHRSSTHGTVAFEVTANADSDGTGDETFGVRLCTSANCAGGTVLGEWTVTVTEPATDTTLSGTGSTVTIPGGSALSVMETTRNGDPRDGRSTFKIALAAAPTEDIIIVGKVSTTARDSSGDPTSIARVNGSPSPDEAPSRTGNYVVARFSNMVTVIDPGNPDANPPVPPSQTTRAPTAAELTAEVTLVAFDNADDTPGGTLTGNLDFTVYKDNNLFRNTAGDTTFGNAEVYTSIAVPSVPVRVTDDDEPTRVRLLPASPADNAATEGNTDKAAVLVKLDRALVAGEEVTALLTYAGAVLGTNFSVAAAAGQTGVTYADNGDTGLVTLAGAGVQEGVVEVTALADSDDDSQTLQIGMPPFDEPWRAVHHRSNLAGGVCAAHGCPNRPQGDPGQRFQSVTLTEATPGLTVIESDDPDARWVIEGSAYSYTVRLNTMPSSDVTVATSIASGGSVQAGSSLTFTNSNWAQPQTVTVRPADNGNDEPRRTLTVNHAFSGDSAYSSLASVNHDVSVLDDDPTTITMTGTGVNIDGTSANISGIMVEGDALRVDRSLTLTLGRALEAGEWVRVPLRVEAVANGSSPTLEHPDALPGEREDLPPGHGNHRFVVDSFRGPRASANVAWPPYHNDVVMTATGTGVAYEHSNRHTPNHIGFRYIEFRGAGAQAATIVVHARDGFDDGEAYDEAFAITFPNDFYVFDSDTDQPFSSVPVQSNLGGGLEAAQPGVQAWFAIADDDKVAPAAGVEVASTWSLKPPGLGEGARFRLLYVTSGTRNASDTGFGAYNSFVRAEITGNQLKQGGVTDLAPHVNRFKAVISANGGGNASINANLEHAGSDAPIYWVGGTKVADNKADFLDGSWDDETNPTHADGTAATISTNGYWTGSEADGQRSDRCSGFQPDDGNRHLRAGAPNVSYGQLNDNDRGPLGQPTDTTNCQPAPNSQQRPLYALSTEEFFIAGGAAIEAAATAAEGSAVTFDVTLTSAAPSGGITIPYTLADGRGYTDDPAHIVATSVDYADAASGSITIAQGATTGTITVNTTDDSTYESDHYFTVTLGTPTGTGGDAPAVQASKGTAVGTITDNADRPVIAFNPATATAAENDGTVDVTVTKTGTTLLPASVYWTTADDTATHPDDYTADAGYLEFAPGETSKTVTIDLVDDADSENAEMFKAQLDSSLVTDAQIGTHNEATVTITDDDGPPSAAVDITMSASDGDTDGNAVENGAGATGYRTITLTLSRALTGAETITVPLSVQGATANVDYMLDLAPATQTGVTLLNSGTTYTAQNPAVRLVSGAAGATLRLRPVNDSDREQPYAVVAYGTDSRAPSGVNVTLGDVTGGPVGIALVDDETGDITVPADWPLKPSGLSGGDTFRLIFVTSETRTAQSTDIDDYNAWVQSVVARNGHARLLPYGGLVKVIGSTTTFDARENTGMWNPSGSGSYTDGSTSDSDSGTKIYWLAAPPSDKVADNYHDFYSSSGWDGGQNQSGNDTTESGASRAVNGDIWTGSYTTGTRLWQGDPSSNGGLGSSPTVAVGNTSPDNTNPLDATVKSNAATSHPMFGISPVFKVATASVTADLSVSGGGAVTEGGTLTVTVTLSGAAPSALSVPVRVASSPAATASAADYTLPSPVTVAMGDTSGTLTFTAVDDMVDEDAETLTLELGTLPAGIVAGSTTSVAVTISDNDTAGVTVVEASGSTTVSEDPSVTDTYTVRLDSQPLTNVVVRATAPAGVQIDGPAAGSSWVSQLDLTFTPSNWQTTQTVTVRGQNDNIVNAGGKRDVTIGQSVHTGDTGGKYTTSTAVANIDVDVTDDDTAGVTVAGGPLTVSEDGTTTTGTYTVRLTSEPLNNVVVTASAPAGAQVSTDGGSTWGSSRDLTFNPSGSGIWSTAQTVHVRGADDDIDNAGDRRAVSIAHEITSGNGDGGSYTPSLGIAAVSVSVTDDDTAGVTVVETSGSTVVSENNSTPTDSYTVVLGSEPLNSVTVTVSVPAGAQVSVDGGSSWGSSRDLTFNPSGSGIWSAARTVAVRGVDDDIDNANNRRVVEITHAITDGDGGRYTSSSPGIAAVSVTVNDDSDAAAVVVVQSGGSTVVPENQSSTDSYTVRLGSEPLNDVIVTATAPAGAEVSVDGGSSWGSSRDLTFNPSGSGIWSTAQTVTVRGTQDVIDNPSDRRDVTITHSIASGNGDGSRYTPSTPSMPGVSVTVNDDDAKPTGISLSTNRSTVSEGTASTEVTVTATVQGSTRFGAATTVAVSVASMADTSSANYVDMTAVTAFNVTIAAGAQTGTGTFTIAPDDDVVYELDNSVTVTGTVGDSAVTVNPATAIALTDDDVAPMGITLSAGPTSVTENGGARTISVTATVDGATTFGSAQTVAVSVAGHDAEGQVGFAQVTNFSVTIPAEAASATEMFTLTPDDNVWHESDGEAAISGTSGVPVSGASVTLTNDDAEPSGVTLNVMPTSLAEDGGAQTVTVTATVNGSTRYGSVRSVTVSQAGSGNAAAVDYMVSAPTAISLAAGAASGTMTFVVTPTDDSTDEFDEVITVSGSGAGITAVTEASVALTDDDDTTVSISASAAAVAENGGTADVTLTLSRALVAGETVTVPLDVVGVTAGSDYTLALHPSSQTGVALSTSGSDSTQAPKVTLSTGASSAVLRFVAVDDSTRTQPYALVRYGTGTRAPSGSGVDFAAPADGPVGWVVTDDETGDVVVPQSWALAPSGVLGQGEPRFRLVFVSSVERDASSTDIAEYDAFVRGLLAEGHADIVPYAGFFTVLGSTSGVHLRDHASVTGSATMPFYWLGETGDATKRVATDNGQFRGEWIATETPSSQSVPRDESGTVVPVDSDGYFTGSTAAGAKSSNPLGSANVTVGYLNDSGSGRAPLGSGQTAAGTATRRFYGLSPVFVRATDPVVSVTATQTSVAEGTALSFTVSAGPAPPNALTVRLFVSEEDGRHMVPDAQEGLKTVSFAAGDTSKTYTVTTTGDGADEADSVVTVRVLTNTGYTVSTTADTATVTVADNDAMTVSVSGGGGTVNEGASLDYTVDPGRSLASGESVTVSFAPAGTAAQGTDYSISCHGSGVSCTGLGGATPVLTITGGSGVRNAVIRVSVRNDSAHPETGETAGISLRSGHSSTGSGGTFSVTGTPSAFAIASTAPAALTASFGAAAYSAGEAAGSRTVTVPVSLSAAAPAGGLSVSYTVGGTAATADRGTLSGAVSFAQGATAGSITVTVVDDNLAEGPETIVLTITDGADYDPGAVSTATVTITDNDAAPTSIALSVDDSSVGEGDGATAITVTATVQGTTRFAQPQTVAITVTGSGGANVVGFTASPSTFSIPIAAGARTGTEQFTLTPTDNNADETDETVTVAGTLSGAAVSSATVTVTDDDTAAAPVTVTLSAPGGDVAEGAAGASGRKDVTVTLGRVLTGSETVTVPLSVQGAAAGSDYTFGLHPASQAGAALVTSGSHSAQNPAVRFSAGASGAVLRFVPVNNAVRTQPYVVIGYGSGALAPSGGGGATLGAVTGGPFGFVVVDDETGDITVPSSWGLAPSGLSAGDDFRLLFRTSTTRDASSSDIADYDLFVRDVLASGGHADIVAYAGFFKAFASTRSSSGSTGTTARVHNGMTSGHTGHFNGANDVWADGSTVPNAGNTAGTPVWWLNGAKLANNYADLCDQAVASGSGVTTGWDIDDPRSETGSRNIAVGVTAGQAHQAWTGTGNACEAYSYPLGNSTVSRAASHDTTWAFMHEGHSARSQQRPLYAMSPVFRIAGAAAVPVADFASASSSAAESAGTRNITVSLSPAPSSSVTVAYTLSGTAVRGSDYTISGVTSNSGTVTVGPSGTAVIAVAITDDSAAESAETVVLTLGNGSGYTVGTAAPVHTLTVSDDDTAGVPVVSVSAGSAVIEGGNAVFTIAASPAATGTISVRYTVTQNGQFLASGRLGSGKQRSLSGASATISIPTESDSVDEADGSVTVTLTGATGYTVGSPSSASVTVRDNDVPAAEFAAGTSDVDEGSGTHLVRVNLSPAPHRGVTVAYTVGGTATRGTDFATAGTVSAAAGAAFVDIPVTIIGDGADEPDETVVLTLTGGAGYEVGSLSVHTVTVADGPTGPPPALSVVTVAAGPAVIEGANATFTLSASLPAAAVSVRYTVTQNGRYLASGQLGSGKAATLSGTSAAIRIRTVDDTVDEAYGSVTVTLEAGAGYTVGAPASATVTVQDEDLPVARFAARTSTAGEGAGTHYVRVLFSTPPHRDVLLGYSVLFSREPGSATRGADFAVEGSSVPVRAGATFADIPLGIVDDSIAEGPETFALRLNIGRHYFLGPGWTRSHTVTITDSGTAVTPAADFAVAASTAAESAGTRNVTVRLVPAPAQSTTVSYALSGTAVRGSDYTISGVTSNTGTVVVGTSGAATIPVAIVDDTATEGDETVVLTLTGGSGYVVGTDSPSHTLTIAANDAAVVPQVSVTAGPAVDEGTAASFTLSASPPATGTISVRYTVTQNGQFVASGQLGSGKTRTLSGAGATISIPTQNDSVDEADGSVTVTLTPASGYTIGSPGSATVTVRDDDVPAAQFTAAASTAAESAGTRNIVVSLAPAPAQALTVSYALSGTAARGSDYTISGVTSNTGTVAVGTSGTATIPVAITDDSAPESAETVVLTLTAGAGYDIGASQSHTLTITDNDTAGVPQVTVTAGAAVDEGGNAAFAVSASPAASGTISVRYTVTQNGQYLTSGQLGSNKTRILSGAGATISIPTQNDSADEADGSVTVTLTPGSGYTVATPAAATVTVRDNDVPAAQFAAAAASVDESSGIRQVRVNLNPVPHRGITMGYTIGGSATRGTDFTAAGSVSVTAGAAFVDIPVTIIDDSSQEPDETVTLTLTGGAGYQVGSRSTHTLTITDQDVSPAAAFATAAAQASEGMGTHQVTLTVLPAPSTPITVRYTISGTATRGADYTAPSGTITVTAGATTAAIDIPITDDTANEGDETVTLTLTAPGGSAGYVLGSPAVFTLTIADDDATPATPRVSFVHESSSVSEHDAARYPSFTISPAPPAPITIHFAIDANASTATLGADYKITWTHPYTLHDNDRDGIWEGTITAPATAPAYGYWRLPTIRPVNDRTREPNETIVLRLLNGPGYTLGDISTYTITITD